MSDGFVPTHTVPAGGLPAYNEANADAAAAATLEAGLPVQLVQRWGDWAKVTCSNGWQCWVDARSLLTPSAPAAAPAGPPSPTGGAAPAAAASSGQLVQDAIAAVKTANPILIGGLAALVVGTVLPIYRGFGPGVPVPNAFKITISALFGSQTSNPKGSFRIDSLGVLALAAALVAVYALTRVELDNVRRIAGAVAAGGAVMVVVQLQRGISNTPNSGVSLTDFIGLGIIVLVAGGAAVAAAPRDK